MRRSCPAPGSGTYDQVELYTSPYAAAPGGLQPKKLADLTALSGVHSQGCTATGEGWAVAPGNAGWEIFRISDGSRRVFQSPPPRVIGCPGGIAGGYIYATTKPCKSCEEDTIVRVKIDALPMAP